MVDTGYCHEPDKVKLIEGAVEGLRLLSDKGFLLVIITNQSGIGRGYFTEKDMEDVNSRLRMELRTKGADFNALFYCPHTPLDLCNCRKPRPGLILQAASEHDLDLFSSFTIGDQESDVQAGKSAGTRTIQISEKDSQSIFADFVARDLSDAAHVILENSVNNAAKSRTAFASRHGLN